MAADIRVNNKVISNVELAVFDKDGTLIDVHVYWANMVRFRAEIICERLGLGRAEKEGTMDSMGVDVERMRIKPVGPVGLKKREIVLQAGLDYLMSIGLPDQADVFREAFEEVDEVSLRQFDKIIRPIDGLYPLVEGLKANGCKIALATTDRSDRAALAMKHLGISDAMDFIAGADMIKNPKPARGIIDLISERLGVPVDRSVMVGDSALDVQTGLNAGCLASIGVESGLTPREELLALTPYVVSDISCITVRL